MKDWPTPTGMMHRSVQIEARYTTCPAALMKKAIREPLLPHSDLPNKVIVYSRIPEERFLFNFLKHLVKNYNHDDLQSYDIITLVGTQKRQQKAMFINSFINMEDTVDFKPQVLCAKAVLEMQALILLT